MGYLNNSTVTVDAILTLKGRELLAKGSDAFNITQFAVGDDEIDYSLWNPDHPLGSAYYGAIIDSMPITEAIPDETQALKYKLVTLPKQTTNMPVVSVGKVRGSNHGNKLSTNCWFGITRSLSEPRPSALSTQVM